ncbi:putative cyclin-D6-1 [Camellia lanceoleosa]|uniref:Cyclin-D6-1 n=1 Tax=Camellia lanceoleosa TaxID=1840588 RepID=A0ACC0H4L6_9ERIC|nr:putative cyclin-D6-1 [Camellia lanceoleosa]
MLWNGEYIKFTWFKPSIIAASVILSASLQVFPAQFFQRTEAVLRCHYIDKDALLLCMEAIGIEVLEDVKEMKELIKIEEAITKEEAKKIDESKKTEKKSLRQETNTNKPLRTALPRKI